ncbi:MAG: RICIN domain-containing protein, partial [Atopobiaceae bacterium]|nr:RICIN domain-containing protein [Atopobiaceae bacterium]
PEAAPAAAKAPAAKAAQQPHDAHVAYRVHVQNVGTQSWRKDGKTAGTSGRSLRLESVEFKVSGDLAGAIYCQVHVQNVGWQRLRASQANGKSAKSGTEGRSLRLEAIKFTLSGELSRWYDVAYRVHVQNDGWQEWKTNGQMAGTSGRSLRLEALELKLVEKKSAPAAKASDGKPGLVYRAHVQDVGWQPQVASGQTAGTTGRSLRVEALKVWLDGAAYKGGVSYQAHVQNVGWQKAASNGAVAGTTGRSLRVEALRLTLTGEIAKHYDVVYRANVQGAGWQPWAVNGGTAGTVGSSLRVEAFQVKLVRKGSYSASEGAYEVTPASDASLALADPSSSASSGAQMRVYSRSGGQAQKYYVRPEGSGTYSVQVVASGLFLADRGGKVVQVADSSSDASQRWKMSWDGGVVLVNASTGKALATPSAPAKGSKAVTRAQSSSASQRWVLGSTQLIANGTYTVTNAAKGAVLDVAGMSYSNGANVMVHPSNGGGNQAFTITHKGKGVYTITCAMTGKAVDVANGSTSNNANVRQWQANGSKAQLWTVGIDRSGKLTFKNKSSGRYLSAAGDGSSNSNVVSSSSTLAKNKKWSLSKSSYKPDKVLQRAMSIADGLSSST